MVRKWKKGDKLYTRAETDQMYNVAQFALAGHIPTGVAYVILAAIRAKADERRNFCIDVQMPQLTSNYIKAFESDKCSYTAPIDPYGANTKSRGRRDFCDVPIDSIKSDKDLSWGIWQHPGKMVENSK